MEGSVVQALTKEPVRKARVVLEVAYGEPDTAFVATTDDAGRFRFADIKAGQYKLTAEKSGYLSATYGAKTAVDEGSLLKVASGDRMHDLALRLFPAGSIGGLVLDSDGDPVTAGSVFLWARTNRNGHTKNWRAGETDVNRSGEYRFDNLLPGTYYVSADGALPWVHDGRQIAVDASGRATRVRELRTFYPATISAPDAQGVSIQSGQERAGIDIRLQRGLTVSVKGRIAGTGGSPSKFTIGASVEAGMGGTSEAGTILPNGEFVFPELPPGQHRLKLMGQGPNGAQVIGETELSVTDQDIEGVMIAPFKPARVQVRVLVEGEEGKPLTAGSVFLNPAAELEPDLANRFMGYIPQNGVYIIDGVRPGKYQLWFSNASECYLKTVQSGDRPLDPNAIEVGEGAVLDLQMMFSRNVASVTGDVDLRQNPPDQAVSVVLISEEPRVAAERNVSWPALDQTLHFSAAHLRPGKYLAFATEERDYVLWGNTEFVRGMQAQSVELELHEKEHANVHLKLITKEETDGARRRLGL